MKSLVVLSIVLATVATTCRAQIISLGQCAVPEVVENFDVSRYLGKWYEIERYEQVFQRNGECVTAKYSLNDDGSVRVENAMLVPPSGKFDIDIGRALLSFPDEDPLRAKLNVSFGGMREFLLALLVTAVLTISSSANCVQLLGPGHRLRELCLRV